MDLEKLRLKIDDIDESLVKLFEERMKIAKDIAEYKKENNLPILNTKREREKLSDIASKSEAEMRSYLRVLYSILFELSRSYQGTIIREHTQTYEKITDAIENTPKLFPKEAVVACQGTEGAYSQLACEKLFSAPNIMYLNTFDSVFSAIESGLCEYGVLPLENSTAGSVNQVYDLMIKYNFNIVKSARVKINHNLLVRKGTKLSDIKEIFSHEHAINQCSEFLKTLGDVKITPVKNTAVAAQMVENSERSDVAAISSRYCAELYNLQKLSESIQNKDNNYTRFICISKNLQIYPGADKTSLMMVLPHKPGSLYKILAKVYALGINLIKLESRPFPERDFEFMFYFDLETSVYSQEFVQLICELEGMCEEFKYLGSYLEVM